MSPSSLLRVQILDSEKGDTFKIQWETRMINIRLSMHIDFYKKNNKNMILMMNIFCIIFLVPNYFKLLFEPKLSKVLKKIKMT